MAHSKAELAEVAARRAELIRFRRAGVRFEDPRILNLGYSSRQHASKDFIRALEERRDDQAAEASVYRQEENERLDALLEAIWSRATEPQPIYKDGEEVGTEIDLNAVAAVLKLMDRRAKLMGLDMPTKAELSGPEGGSIPLGGTLNEFLNLVDTAGDGSPDDGPGSGTEAGDDGRNA